MAWDKEWNFRATSTYVTDGPNATHVIDTDTYPKVRNGATFGWVTANGNTRDRTTGNDVRLCGMNFISSGGRQNFQIDLPNTGTYTIRLANGDAGGAQDLQYIDMLDNTTVFNVVDTAAIGSNTFNDATGVNRTAAAWPADNVAVSRVFGSTLFLTRVAKTTAYGSNHVIAHISVSEQASASVSVSSRRKIGIIHPGNIPGTFGRNIRTKRNQAQTSAAVPDGAATGFRSLMGVGK